MFTTVFVRRNFSIYLCLQLYKEKRLCLLSAALSDVKTFSRMLTVTSRRVQLLACFQVIVSVIEKPIEKLKIYRILRNFLLESYRSWNTNRRETDFKLFFHLWRRQ